MKKAAIIMAGGLDNQFWPRSTKNYPKAYSYITGEGTLLQNTVNRLIQSNFSYNEIFIVTSYNLLEITKAQLPELAVENIISEPIQRGTATCMALASYIVSNRFGDDTIIAVFPSDHCIKNLKEFEHTIDIAFQTVEETGGLVTIGLEPKRPETAYGYIQYSNSTTNLGQLYAKGVRKCIAFAEKPDIATADRFIKSGDFLWNSGIYFIQLKSFFTKLERLLPNIFTLFSKLPENIESIDYINTLENIYKILPNLSIDNGVLEKVEEFFVVMGTFDWTDLNNWDEYFRISKTDSKGNLFLGNIHDIDNKNCLVISDDKPVGLIGMENLIVINTKDAILICKKDETQKVDEIINYLKRKNINNF